MPGPNDRRVNPLSGKRYSWEAEQAAKKAADAQTDTKAIGQQIALLERLAQAKKAQDDLLTFTQFTMPDPEFPNDVTKSRYKAAKVHREVAKALTAFINDELKNPDGSVCNQLIFCMPPRHGKACAHDTPVLTTSGWRTHGELKVGDFVFGIDGAPTEVTALSAEVDEVVPVVLSNGEIIRCHPNHEWTVNDRSTNCLRTLETREIAKRALHTGPAGKRGGRYTLQLPDVGAVQFPEAELPLHPYVLGAWLGDGSEGSTRLAHDVDDVEVVEAIEALGHKVSWRYVQPETSVGYVTFAGTRGRGSTMQKALKSLGVIRGKHVPETYLRAAVGQRLELLAGLVDTD
jgi:hypothetical protein